MKRNQKGFAGFEIITMLALTAVLVSLGYYIYHVHQTKKSNVVVLSPQQASHTDIVENAKFSEALVDIRWAVYNHENSVNSKCVGMDDSHNPILLNESGKTVDIPLNESLSVPGYAILKNDFCEPGTQLYGITNTPADGSDVWHFVAKTDSYFMCDDLKMYKIPSDAISKPSCLDSTGRVMPYNL